MSDQFMSGEEFSKLPAGWYFNLNFKNMYSRYRFLHVDGYQRHIWLDYKVASFEGLEYENFDNIRRRKISRVVPLTCLAELLYGLNELDSDRF